MSGFVFGAKSEAVLATVEPVLARVVRRALTLTTCDFGAFEGVRTIERQKKLVASGASQTLKSRHLPNASGLSEAVDLVPWIDSDGDGDKEYAWHYGSLIIVARAMHTAARIEGVSIITGSCWRDLLFITDVETAIAEYVAAKHAIGASPFIDLPHFQLPPV